MPVRFLIVGTQRTGSQALFQALNLHPEVLCGGEWTQTVPCYKKISVASMAINGDYRRVVKNRPEEEMHRFESVAEAAGWFGFKVLFRSSDKWFGHPRLAPALLLDRLEGHLGWLRQRPDIRVIQLVRKDGVEWLKSKYLSRATGNFTHTQYPDDVKVTIPLGRALRALKAKDWVDRRLSSLASSNPYHRIIYEDFAADNRGALNSCLTFLGCDVTKLPLEGRFIKRQSSQTAASYIKNFEELVVALNASGLRMSSLRSS